jgi:hypothetical protein
MRHLDCSTADGWGCHTEEIVLILGFAGTGAAVGTSVNSSGNRWGWIIGGEEVAQYIVTVVVLSRGSSSREGKSSSRKGSS